MLDCEISEYSSENRHHSFKIKPKNQKRVYILQAENDALMQNWLQALYTAKIHTPVQGGESNACTIQ